MVVVPFFLCVFFRFSVRKERAFRCQLLKRKRLDSREIRRERESGMMMMSRRSFAFAHTKKRVIHALQRGEDEETRERRFFSPIYYVRAYKRVG